MKLKPFVLLFLCVGLLLPGSFCHGAEFDFSTLSRLVVEETLENGLKVIILPRHDAPVVSFVTWANVGGVDDPKELSGLAHMLEHMAFKGTSTIGTRDPEAELSLMAREDEIFSKIRAERLKGILADQERIKKLEKEFENAIAEAYKIVVPNEFTDILQREGGAGLNAFTSRDQTAYIVSLPSNKIELWMAMESERFLNPRFREMYKEREVVAEERRMIVEAHPTGRLIEEFLATAFKAHPYRKPIVGHMSDIQNYSREAVEEFFEAYYSPSNMSIVMVGDVEPQKGLELARKYWGRLPRGPEVNRIATVEPPQNGERRVTIIDPAQPSLIMGWHVPQGIHPDTPAINAMMDVLGGGRTSRLYRRMVIEEKTAISASAFSGFPGDKYPALACVFVHPAQGKTIEENENSVLEEVERIKKDGLTEEELEGVKARAMSSLIGGMRGNMGLAQALARSQQLWGDWRRLFDELDRINAVTREDVIRVAQQYFTDRSRTVAQLTTEAPKQVKGDES